MLSIKEVAKLTGLSTATVSRALDPRYAARVKPENREKILAVCDSENYRPDMAGRSFVTGKRFKVGFISADPAGDCGNQLFGFFMQGVTLELQEAGFNLLLLGSRHSSGCDERVVDFLRSNVADGYIIGTSLITEKVSRVIAHCKVPVLLLEKQPDCGDALIVRRDMRNAFKEIWADIPPEAYKQVLFCCQPRVLYRYQMAAQCAPAGVELPLMTIESGKNFAEVRHQSYQYARRMIPELKKYRIFWCSSDLAALGIMDALEESDWKMGKDFFLIGFDNLESNGAFSDPPLLSTVDSCWERIGKLSAQLLLEAIEGKVTAKTVDFQLPYIRRKSFPGQRGKNNVNC